MKIRIMLDCDTEDEAFAAMDRLRGVPGQAVQRIDPKDNPEYGADVMAVRQGAAFVSVPMPPAAPLPVAAAPAAPSLAGVGFGQGVTLPAGAIPAPASAVAAPSATVPAAPSGIPATPSVPTVPAAPPVAAAPVPTAPAAPPASAPAGVTLDTAGLPWDGRIHANTKTTNKDGTWRQKRELDPAIRAAVEAELRGVMAANAAATPVAQSATPLPPAAPPAVPLAPTAAVPQPPTPAPATPEASGASPSNFGELMERLVPKMTDGSITNQQVAEALATAGLTAIGQLALAPNLVPQIAQALGVA